MTLRRTALWLALATSVAGLSGCGGQTSAIKIGEYGSMTGTTADFGITTHNGIMLAADQINARGGVLNRQVQIVLQDDRGDPAEARTAVTRLIDLDKVVAILGEVASSRSIAAGGVCQARKIPMVSPSSTNPKVTQGRDYVFRICFTDDFQGAVCAKFAAASLKLRKAAILRDVKNDYSVGLADSFAKTFTKMGGSIVEDESYSEGDKDFSSQLTAIRAKNPQIIFVPGYYTEVALIARRARQLGIKAPMLGGDGWDSSVLVKNAGDALEGCYFSNHFSPESKDPAVQRFVNEYRRKYNTTPNALAALGYDAAHILLAAISKAGSTQGSKVRDALAATTAFPGVTGRISIDKNRNAVKPAVIIQIQGARFVPVETIAP